MPETAKFNIREHTSYYADAIIPHKVTFIELESPNWIKPNEYNKIKLAKITVRVIEPIDKETNPQATAILNQYKVIETYSQAIGVLQKVLSHRKLGTGNIILWGTLDIVRLNGSERIYHSLNIMKDDKTLLSMTTQNVEVDGDKFPSIIIPFNLLIGKTFNYQPTDSKETVIEIASAMLKHFSENPYYHQVIKSIPPGYAKAITHFITTIIPTILSEYTTGNITYKNRDLDTLITIKKNDLVKQGDWSVFIINMEGVAKFPLIIKNEVKLFPRPLGNEYSNKASLNIIPIREMYTDFIEDLKVISTELKRR